MNDDFKFCPLCFIELNKDDDRNLYICPVCRDEFVENYKGRLVLKEEFRKEKEEFNG